MPLALALGIAATVIDPRGLFAADARFAGLELDRRWPDEALADWRPNAASAVVALTHDPKLDDVALAAALRSPAFYIAALGSRKNHGRAAANGWRRWASMPKRWRGCTGRPGWRSARPNPVEIALSIAAEMTAAWRGVLPPRG